MVTIIATVVYYPLNRVIRTWKDQALNAAVYRLQRKPADDCTKTEIKMFERKKLPKFSLICFLLGQIYKLMKTNESCTKRELFYRNVEFLSSQISVNEALNDISSMLDASLYEMNIHCTSKGLIFGEVIIQTSTDEIDCSAVGGTSIPADVADLIDIKSEATFILIVEKDTVFQRLLDDNIMDNLSTCIIITGKGFPDISTRILLKKMWDFLRIPILVLVDADPWGIEIMCIYRFGSLSMVHESEGLTIPSIRWLGVFPSEATSLSSTRVHLDEKDRKLISELLDRPYTRCLPRLTQELQNAQFKAEIEGIDIPTGYLAHKYIPSKIAANDFI